MLQKIVMPKLGETMEEGTIINWLVAEGDSVRKGDIVMNIETDKAVLEVESFVEGTVLKIVVPEAETVPVGAVVAYVGDEGDVPPAEAPREDSKTSGAGSDRREKSKPADFTALPSARNRQEPPDTAASISPRAKELARQLGVDISQVKGSGPGGRITSRDVQAFHDR